MTYSKHYLSGEKKLEENTQQNTTPSAHMPAYPGYFLESQLTIIGNYIKLINHPFEVVQSNQDNYYSAKVNFRFDPIFSDKSDEYSETSWTNVKNKVKIFNNL